MKNITITLDEKTAAWARVVAARRSISLSRFLSELLRERMHESRDYDEAMRRYLESTLAIRAKPGARTAKREELHDRSRLR